MPNVREAIVSILTRLGGRVRPGSEYAIDTSLQFQSSPGLEAGCDQQPIQVPRQAKRFQSSPGLEAGCDATTTIRHHTARMFQSSPGLEAGCDPTKAQAIYISGCFNPHPAWRPGATRVLSGV